MKAKLLIATVAALAIGGNAQAAMIAGWDFSQYSNVGFLSFDGATLENTLKANHSDLDPTQRSGIESNLFGTQYLNGLYGSFNTPLDFTDPYVPNAVNPNNDLVSNVNQAFLGFGSPAACTQGQVEGMPNANCNTVAMTSIANVSVVFDALPGALNPLTWGDTWTVRFAGKMVTNNTSSIGVSYSTDGVNYSSVGTALLNTIDTLYSFALPAGLAQKIFVKLDIQASDAVVPAIDNLGIGANLVLVPEPGTALLLGAGLIGLARAGNRRS